MELASLLEKIKISAEAQDIFGEKLKIVVWVKKLP